MRPSLALIVAGLVGLAGCPDDPYSYKTWTKQLGDRHESERAVNELENLGDPAAIDALGDQWVKDGKPARMLQVMIGLARPLTPDEAKAKYMTDFEQSGRPDNWKKALPYLRMALKVDETNPRSVDSAAKAADALGESKLEEALSGAEDEKLGSLVALAQRDPSKKALGAQVAAIRAIGKYDNQKMAAAQALMKVIDRDPPDHPKTMKDKPEQQRAAEEKYGLFLAVTGASINALGDLRYPGATKTLVLSLYRTPELFTQVRRALVATGPSAKEDLRHILRGDNQDVEALFTTKKYAKYCGDKNELPPDQCQPVSAHDFYPAVVLGDFYDPETVPDLLAALKRPALPVYYQGVDEGGQHYDQPSPNTQYNAIFDAIRKIGSPNAASTVLAMWRGGSAPAAAPKKGKAAAEPAGDSGTSLITRALAISAYPFVTRDEQGVEDLGRIAADNKADDNLRQEAATAFARLSHNGNDVAILEGLAQKYFDASRKKHDEAQGKPKTDADAADKEFEKDKAKHEAVKKEVDTIKLQAMKTRDKADQDAAKAAGERLKKADDDFKAAKKKHSAGTALFKNTEKSSKDYKGFARMFQTHIARIEVAIRCKDDMKCYADSLKLKPEEAAKNNASYIRDIKEWTDDEKLGLVEAAVERSMLELGKRGQKASQYMDLLLDNAKSDNRLIRQSILLALPKIAATPCNTCEAKLDKAIKAGEGKTTIADLNLETTMLRNYFSWAGGKTPSTSPPPADVKDSTPAPPPTKAAPAKAAPAPAKQDTKPAGKGKKK
jgi:hypothetical protein